MAPVRIVIAPDCFTGTLTAGEAAEAIASGWARSAPHDELVCVPLSDGGPGFVDVLAASLGGQPLALTVSDPLGRPVPATVLVVEDAGTRTAYVESAQACGLHLLAQAERDPRRTSTYGVGEMVLAAVEHGAGRIVVGLAGSGTNDAGAGLLAALGVGSPERLARGGLALDQVAPGDLAGLDAATDRLRGRRAGVRHGCGHAAARPAGRERHLRTPEGRQPRPGPGSRSRARPLRRRRAPHHARRARPRHGGGDPRRPPARRRSGWGPGLRADASRRAPGERRRGHPVRRALPGPARRRRPCRHR